jgi:hypothetical protein
MSRAVSLRDCYDSEGALQHPDPMVRIAALHHAGPALDENDRLRHLVVNRLEDADERVARYAAIVLAQAGDAEGLRHVLAALGGANTKQVRPLELCLRNCTRFPFAVLLSRLVALGEGSKRGGWSQFNELLFLRAEEFWERYCRDPALPARTADELNGIRGLIRRPQVICILGTLDRLPEGDQPGSICLKDPKRALQRWLTFWADALLNPEGAWPGQEALVVGHGRVAHGRLSGGQRRHRLGRRGGRERDTWVDEDEDDDVEELRKGVSDVELVYPLSPL